MSEPPENSLVISQWVAKAENDLRNAEHTLALEEDCPLDTVCFHAQQCTEKYLKAFLLSHGIDFRKMHDLRLLMQLLPGEVSSCLNWSAVMALNRYSVETRYPGDWEPIMRTDAEQAVAIARQVRATIRAHLPEASLQR